MNEKLLTNYLILFSISNSIGTRVMISDKININSSKLELFC